MLHVDTGNTAFMLVASALVLLMTPALAFFYGGLVGHKNVGAIMFQSFVSMGWTTLLWVVCGHSLDRTLGTGQQDAEGVHGRTTAGGILVCFEEQHTTQAFVYTAVYIGTARNPRSAFAEAPANLTPSRCWM